MSRPQILCISLSPILRDGRVLRQISVLLEHGDVTVVGFGPAPEGVAEYIQVPDSFTLPQTPLGVANLAMRRLKSSEMAAPAMKAARELIGERRFDLVVANEARALPLAFAVSHGAPVWGDMHEWAPGERDQVRVWRLLVKPLMEHICATYLSRCAAVTTVSEGIVDEYERVYGVRPELLRNARAFVDLEPTPVADDGPIRLVHSGGAVPGRRLELLIQAVADTPGVTLDLYLVPAADGGKYLSELEALAGTGSRVTLHPPTTPDELPATLNAYDVGVFYLDPQNLNMEQTLPNKLFDFLQARLGIVVTPNPEMKRFTLDNDLGVVSPDFTVESFARTIGGLTADSVRHYKRSSHEHARALSSEQDVAVAHGIVSRLLGQQA